MSEKRITIRMPQASLDKWLAALRSGEYKQGVGILETSSGMHCCLGVLQKCLTGDVERHACGEALRLPTTPWLEAHNIRFYGRIIPHPQLVGNPYLPKLREYASNANDCGRYDFLDIADAIEACAEGF